MRRGMRGTPDEGKAEALLSYYLESKTRMRTRIDISMRPSAHPPPRG